VYPAVLILLIEEHVHCRPVSGVARICIWRGLGARSATGTAGGAKGAGGRAGVGPGGVTPLPEGGSGISPRENFRNLTTLMCIFETENFTFVLHVHS
jgi:hypothetical protein